MPNPEEAAQLPMWRQEAKRIEPILTVNNAPREALTMVLGANCKDEHELAEFKRILELGYLARQQRLL